LRQVNAISRPRYTAFGKQRIKSDKQVQIESVESQMLSPLVSPATTRMKNGSHLVHDLHKTMCWINHENTVIELLILLSRVKLTRLSGILQRT
jgi:hypothetical protein